MKITIQGEDYTSALDAVHPLIIERSLNEPSVCRLWISIPTNTQLATPLRNHSLAVIGDDGTTYFTGYLAVNPLPEYAGMGVEGPRYRIALEALSDELLLDHLPMAPSKGATGQAAGNLMTSLVTRTGATSLSSQGLTLNTPVSKFVPDSGANWSQSAGKIAGDARAAYRALNGSIDLVAIPSSVHALSESDGSLDMASLAFTAGGKRALANDITVCGEHEPVAYVVEYFLGDGVTTQFNLAANPYFPPSSKSILIRELFNESAIDSRLWGNPTGQTYFSIGAGGLTMAGGNGTDGDTLLTWIDPVEMGGTLLLEASGITLSTGSIGILAGFLSA